MKYAMVVRVACVAATFLTLQQVAGCGGKAEPAPGTASEDDGGVDSPPGAGGAQEGGAAGGSGGSATGGTPGNGGSNVGGSAGVSGTGGQAGSSPCAAPTCSESVDSIACTCSWHCENSGTFGFQCKTVMGTFECSCMANGAEVDSCKFGTHPSDSHAACTLGTGCCGNLH